MAGASCSRAMTAIQDLTCLPRTPMGGRVARSPTTRIRMHCRRGLTTDAGFISAGPSARQQHRSNSVGWRLAAAPDQERRTLPSRVLGRNNAAFTKTEGTSPLYTIPAHGGDQQRMLDCVMSRALAMTPPNNLYYLGCTAGSAPVTLHKRDLTTGRDEILGTIEKGPRNVFLGLAVSPDGKTILYARFVTGIRPDDVGRLPITLPCPIPAPTHSFGRDGGATTLVMTTPRSIDATTAPKCSSSICGSVVNSQYNRRPASAISPHPRPQRMPVATDAAETRASSERRRRAGRVWRPGPRCGNTPCRIATATTCGTDGERVGGRAIDDERKRQPDERRDHSARIRNARPGIDSRKPSATIASPATDSSTDNPQALRNRAPRNRCGRS